MKWLFWKFKPKIEHMVMEVDPDDEEIVNAHVVLLDENERLIKIICDMEKEMEILKLDNQRLRGIIKMGESK